MTASVGFRSPRADELAHALLARLADGGEADQRAARYRDPAQPATTQPGAIPAALQAFAGRAIARALKDPMAIERTLGEWLTEPKAQVWFEPAAVQNADGGVRLDRRSRMAYDARHIFINGESLRAAGRDATLMRRLADQRQLDARAVRGASGEARAVLDDWMASGWIRAGA